MDRAVNDDEQEGRDALAIPDPIRHRVLVGVLRRVARTRARETLVLRGGLLARLWSLPAHRPADDVDFLATFAFDRERTVSMLREALTSSSNSADRIEDGVTFLSEQFHDQVIWEETHSPGVRVIVPARCEYYAFEVQIDVGFGDVLEPPAIEFDYPAPDSDLPVRLLATPVELGIAWKLHGLFEFGRGRWRAKDLWDLYLWGHHATVDRAQLMRAVRVAFESRGLALTETQRLFQNDFGLSRGARRKWSTFRRRRHDPSIPEEHLPVVQWVADYFRPLFVELGAL
jgi:hypothetical protein